MTKPAPTIALIVAAGRGTRAGGALPKQYQLLDGVPVLRRTLQAFLAHPSIDAVAVVIHPDDAPFYAQSANGLENQHKLLPWIAGGPTRQSSVHNGLKALHTAACVLVHDGARPFVSAATIDEVLAALATHEGAIAALPVSDTLKRGDRTGSISDTIDRAGLWAAQTPQAFRFTALLAAHEKAASTQRTDFTDDASLLEADGIKVALVASSADNIKLTNPEDFTRAEAILRAKAPQANIRTGIGYDVHAFTDGDHVTLGGVRIPHDRGVLAHSDGDVALHALTDAILGALGDGDIGQHFPPSDMQWRGASSDRFLAYAAQKVAERGGRILHLDTTILAEAPKVGPHRAAMQAAIAAAAGIGESRVSIKATTTEKLGFVGKREGLAAMSVATIELP